MSHAHVVFETCPNCNSPMDGHFCAECGQKAAPLNPTFRDLMHDLTHELLHVDGKIFQSVRLLLTRPGFLTCEYFDGRRARYVSPLRLYLIFSVIFFAVSAISTNVGDPLSARDGAELAEAGVLGTGSGPLDRIGAMKGEEVAVRVRSAQKEWFPRVMFVLVPVCALLVAAVTRSTGRNYPQHLYFALHAHAAVFAALAFSPLVDLAHIRWLSATAASLATVYWMWYPIVAFRTAYGGSWWLAVGRTVVVTLVYSIAVGIVFALAVLGALSL